MKGLNLRALCALAVLSFGTITTINANSSVVDFAKDNKILGVNFSDVSSATVNKVSMLKEAKDVAVKILKTNPSGKSIIKVHTTFLNDIVDVNKNLDEYYVLSLVEAEGRDYFFERVKITITKNKEGQKLDLKSEVLSPIALRDFDASMEVGLVARKLIIKDDTLGVKMVFPIGVGSFDEGVLNEGVTTLLTPRFENAIIPKKSIITKRDMPRYFDGKPFIRIHDNKNGNDLRTEIGFHIEINKYFNRGFDSHGCMRLRENDLYLVHDLLLYGAKDNTPIRVKFHLEDSTDHPAKLNNAYFKTVLNKGTKESPFFIRDRDLLIQTSFQEKTPPFHLLKDVDGDNYHDFYSYDSNEQMKEQMVRRKAECTAKLDSGELAKDDFEDCMQAGFRKKSVKDWIYRKWTHGK